MAGSSLIYPSCIHFQTDVGVWEKFFTMREIGSRPLFAVRFYGDCADWTSGSGDVKFPCKVSTFPRTKT